MGNGQSSIIAKAVNKQNTSKLLLYKLYFKMILKSFDFQCDFDFQITSSKMILILNHLYLGDLILKSSTFDDFAHLCIQSTRSVNSVEIVHESRQIMYHQLFT